MSLKSFICSFLVAVQVLTGGIATYTASSLVAASTAEAGLLKSTVKLVAGAAAVSAGKKLAKKGMQKAVQKGTEHISKQVARKARDFQKELINPSPQNLGFNPLSPVQRRNIKQKILDRTATRQEHKRFESDRRFSDRRERGVKDFWQDEFKQVKSGQPGSRNWNKEQTEALINGNKPKENGKAFEGHHRFSAKKYPHLADNPKQIVPATRNEHLYGWHGGNFRNPTHGKPLNPGYLVRPRR